MKQKLFTFFLALLASVGTIFAESGTCGDNLTWDLTDGVLTISGTGDMYDYLGFYGYDGDVPWYNFKNDIATLIINNGVTNIGGGAFSECSSLTSVTIPNSVTNIRDYAFYGCTSLTSVILPNSVINTGEMAFFRTGLTTPIYNDHVFAYMPTSYSGQYAIPDGIESIGGGAFAACTTMTAVTIPYSVINIGVSAFVGCTALTSVTIPNSVTEIGDYAFCACIGLTSIEIPNSVTSIERHVFQQCSNLTNIYATCGDLDRLKQLLDNDSRVKYEPIPYSLVIQAENGMVVTNYDSLTICDEPNVNCAVIPNYGYHFVQWTDGNTDNPRTIVLTQDTTLSAICAPNQYSISVTCDENYGQIEGENGTFDYLTPHEYAAVPIEGYHFTQWSDGIKINPRTIVLTQDTTIMALFAINTYLVKFFGFNNVLLDSQSIEHGAAAVAPEVPIVDHFDFVGWDKEFTNITSNLDVYAIYQKNTEDVENLNVEALPQKVMIDGQILILRGDHVYTLTGQELE